MGGDEGDEEVDGDGGDELVQLLRVQALAPVRVQLVEVGQGCCQRERELALGSAKGDRAVRSSSSYLIRVPGAAVGGVAVARQAPRRTQNQDANMAGGDVGTG